ncbi:EpsG family protein [Clostridium paraputrificum]|uniref:EpsG family protein n=1 Tax=Clostridium paraputrificum TaxID=29363 RepID=UPI00232BD89D|nr:EpsG family protein [Clostridium paraputrificum]MDB2106218.1 EpsG family protein [Clostridium paraputrificum]MDB2112909.1 EpsG family protein [Clostridium paraputrificum]
MIILTWIVFLMNPMVGIMFVLIGLLKDKKHSTQYSMMMALLLASFAFWFIPNHEMDLTRYFDQLYNYSNLPWNIFLKEVLSKQILFIQELLFYFIAKTGNFHLLPAIVIFCVYFILFYMITDYCKRRDIGCYKSFACIFTTIMILPYPSIVSNVRNVLAFSIFIYGIYREYIQNKKNIITVLLYVIPIFIHISSVALVAIRLLVPLYKRARKFKLILSGGILTVPFIINKVVPLLNLGNGITSAFLIKANNYVNKTENDYAIYIKNSLFMKMEKFYFIALVVFLLGILFLMKYYKREKEITCLDNNIYLFFELLSLTVIGTVPIIITVYLRFTIPVIMMLFILILEYKKYINKKIYKRLISISLFLFVLFGFLHQIVLLQKMTNINFMIINVLVRSIFNMFIM